MGGRSSSSSSSSADTTTQNTDKRTAADSGGYAVGADATVTVDMFDPAVMAELANISASSAGALGEGFKNLGSAFGQMKQLAVEVVKGNNKVLSERTSDTAQEMLKSNTYLMGGIVVVMAVVAVLLGRRK